MKYTGEQSNPKSGRSMKLIGRVAALILLIVGGILLFQYRSNLSTRISKVVAASEDEPIPVTKLSRQPFSLTVPSTGEIVGLETTPVATPNTSSGSLKIAWLIAEGSFVQAGAPVIRFDSTDAKLSLEKQQNTLNSNQENTKIKTLQQSTDEKVLTIDRSDAEEEYQYAMTVMPQDESIFSKWDIITAQADAHYAKERIEFLKNKAKTQQRIARSDQQILAIERNKAQSEVAVIKETLNSLELRAPVGGLVLYRRDHREDPQIGDESHPGQVVIDVTASALNFPDLLMTQGLYQEKPPLPFVVGTELSGTVTAVGEGVKHLKVGDAVVSACGRTMAERVAAPAMLVIPAPRNLPLESAAGICITYFTTMHALKQRAALQPGVTLLVLGAAGGVGTTAVELGRQMGATVIAAASSAEKLELAKSLGAEHLINYSTEDLKERVKEITRGKGVDVVYDPVGGALAEAALRSMAWKGRYLVIGFAAGDIPRIPLNLPLLKGCSVVGVFWGSFVGREPQVQMQNVAELWALFESGKLKPVVGETHRMEGFAAAFDSLRSRRALGKVVVLV